MKYDDASWHYNGNFPKELPQKAGATHIGMFLAWCLLHDLGGEIHISESPPSIDKLKSRQTTPGAFLIDVCDEKFTNEDLSVEGNAFAKAYYLPNDSKYPGDYHDALGLNMPSTYHIGDSWINYDRLSPIIKKRFNDWKAQLKI